MSLGPTFLRAHDNILTSDLTGPDHPSQVGGLNSHQMDQLVIKMNQTYNIPGLDGASKDFTGLEQS